MTAALVLIGAPGSGKSTVLDALATELEREGVAHGAIETEELTRGFPLLGNAVLAEQLGGALSAQRRAGRRLFLIAFTAESSAELRAVLDAAQAEPALVVCLRAPADVLAARVGAREPERWPGKPGLVAHARALAETVPAIAGVDLVLDTDGRDAEDVAGTVLAAMRERGLFRPTKYGPGAPCARVTCGRVSAGITSRPWSRCSATCPQGRSASGSPAGSPGPTIATS